MRTILVSLVVLAAAAAVAAHPAAAKGGVEARLLTPVPRDAAPGSRLEVAWTLSVLVEGQRQPLNADRVFVRLVGRAAEDEREAFAAPGAHPSGDYAATVVVPRSGIARVEIGVAGARTDASGARRADALFPLVDASPPPRSTRGRSTTALVLAAGAALAALARAGRARRALRPARRRSAAPDPGSS